MKEDEFNRNAALVPESDPNASIINDRILQLKENVDHHSTERTHIGSELKKVMDLRTAAFLEFFDKVASQVEKIYSALTVKESNLN